MAGQQEQHILLDRSEHIAWITLNRPDRLNALTPAMVDDLAGAIEAIGKDDEVRVVVVAGAGRGFCAGVDMGGLGGQRETSPYTMPSADAIRRGFSPAQAVVLGLQRMEKPTIAMVNGVATGAGMDLACACDLRTGSPNTRFMSAFIRIGLFPGWGGTWLYPRVMGLPKAAEMIFTGDFLEAEEAHRLGVLNKLVPAEKLEEATRELARKIANGPPVAIRLAKLNLYKGLEIDLETAMKFAAAAETITLTSEDHKEGVKAFTEKRPPRFQGR